MLSRISSFFTPPSQSKPPEPMPNGKLVLQLLHENSPALLDALETNDTGVLSALIWANKPPQEAAPSDVKPVQQQKNSQWPKTHTFSDAFHAAQASKNPSPAVTHKRQAADQKFKPSLNTIFENPAQADMNRPNENGDTLLLKAAKTGDYPHATRKLLKAGAKLNHQNSQGFDALMLNTLHQNRMATQAVLDEHRNQQIPRDSLLNTILGNMPEFPGGLGVPVLSLNQDNDGNTALGHAIQQDDNYGIYQLTDAGVKPDDANHKGETALIQAAKAGNTYACLRLLKNRAAITPQDGEGKTALMHWIHNIQIPSASGILGHMIGHRFFSKHWHTPGFFKVSQELVKGSRPEINLQDNEGKSALSHMATAPIAHSIWGNWGAGGLCENGANVDLPDKNGLTPVMHFAKKKPKNIIENAKTTSFSVLALSRNINKKDPSGKTALIHAAENGNFMAIQGILMGNYSQPFLGQTRLNAGLEINPNIQDEKGQTALMALSALDPNVAHLPIWSKVGHSIYSILRRQNERTRIIREQLPYRNPLSRSTKMLLLVGASPNQKNNAGETALMIAAKHGNLPVIQVLCERPETLNQKNPAGKSALQLAQEHHQDKAVKMLLNAGATPDA